MNPRELGAVAKTPPAESLGTRTVLDALVQAATVDLFRAHRVAVAPAPAFAAVGREKWPDSAAAIKFNSTDLNGVLTLCMSTSALEQVITTNRQQMWTRDVVRELTNQLMGRIKNRLLQCKVTLTTGLPSLLYGDAIASQTQKGRSRVYPFRLLRGECFVIIDGVYTGTGLTYSGSEGGVSEGDVIIF